MATTLEVIVGGAHNGLGAISGGTTYNLSNRVDYIHLGNDGFGLTEFERYTESGSLQDGATDRGFNLRPRKVQLVLNMVSDSELEYWQTREQTLGIFTPRDNPIILKITTPVRTYYLDCFTEGGLTFPSTDKQGNVGHKLAVQLVAPNPLFYTTVFREVALLTGSQSLPRTTNFTYAGNYKSFPTIFIQGPLTNFTINSVDDAGNTHSLSFPSYSLTTGNYLSINTRYGYKTVRENGVTNRIDKLSVSSALATFAIFPRLGTTAQMSVSGTSNTSATLVALNYEDKFIGF